MSWRGKRYVQLLRCEFTKEYPNEERKYNTELEVVNPLRDIDETWIMVKKPTSPLWKEEMEQTYKCQSIANNNETKEIQLTGDKNEETKNLIKRRKRKKYPYWKKELRKRYNARRKRKHKKRNVKN